MLTIEKAHASSGGKVREIIVRLVVPCFSVLVTPAFFWLALTATANADISTVPDTLTVTATRHGVEERQLLIQSTEAVKSLQIIPLDLNSVDGAGVLPAKAIQANLQPGTQIATNSYQVVPIKFDLGQLARSGEYGGSLVIRADGGQYKLPVAVRVKDPFPLPLLLLILGCALGVGVSIYRSEGLARDELTVQMGRLRNRMRGEQELAKSFQTKIEGCLIDAETAIENRQWETARKAVETAQIVWNKWRKGREDWLAQLAYQALLSETLENSVDPGTSYYQSLKVSLDDAERETVEKESPQELKRSLEDLKQQINRYLEGKNQIDQMSKLLSRVPQNQEMLWRQKALNLENQLKNLSPSDKQAFADWQKVANETMENLIQAIEQQGEKTVVQELTSREILNSSPSLLPPVPSAKELPSDPTKAAQWRVRGFNWVGYATTIILLAGVGFNQLYVTKPTFGANWFGDYFALLAWGFGAEVTRESIAKVVQGLGLPGTK